MSIVSGGPEPVSVAATADYVVVSASPDWTEEDWSAALAPYQHLNAYLAGMNEDCDGTELYFFKIPEQVAA